VIKIEGRHHYPPGAAAQLPWMAQPTGLELELELEVRVKPWWLPFEDGNGTDGTAGVAVFTCLMRREVIPD
jgi:hypothetical protein